MSDWYSPRGKLVLAWSPCCFRHALPQASTLLSRPDPHEVWQCAAMASSQDDAGAESSAPVIGASGSLLAVIKTQQIIAFSSPQLSLPASLVIIPANTLHLAVCCDAVHTLSQRKDGWAYPIMGLCSAL